MMSGGLAMPLMNDEIASALQRFDEFHGCD
jgi:hypothetical protein